MPVHGPNASTNPHVQVFPAPKASCAASDTCREQSLSSHDTATENLELEMP